MKNLIYVMKDLRMPNKLKAFAFDVVKKFGSFSFQWLRQGL